MVSPRKEWARIRSNSLARNASWMFFGRGLSIGFQALYFILLARLLGSTEYGIYAGVVAMVGIVSIYAPLGSGLTLLRHISPDHSKFAPYWGNALVTVLTLGSLFVGFLIWVVPLLAHSYSWRLVLCVAIGDCLCGQLTDVASRVFMAFEKLRITASLILLTNLLRMVLAGLMLWRLHHATAQQWVIAIVVVSFIGCCLAVTLVTRYYGKPSLSLRLLRQRTGEGFVYALSSSSAGIYNSFDKAMLGHYGMNAANGIYSMAYRVIDLCMIPIDSIHNAAFPRFFQKGVGGVQSTRAYARRILRITAPIGLLLGACLFLAAPVVPHVVGKSFEGSVAALRWLCLLPVLRSLHYSAGDALTGAGHQNLRLGSQVAVAAFNFGVNLYLIPQYGWLGAAWSSLASDGLLAVFNWTGLLRVQAIERASAA
jgi:O-antigen/teichoic acid export membrane protein